MKRANAKIGTIIGKGTVIGGDFSAEKSVRMDGLIEGNVKVAGEIVVGAKGRVNGNVEAASAIIGGEVYGDIIAPERVELTVTARVIGNIKTNIIVIDEKAVFQGACDMNQDVSAEKAKRRLVRETGAGKKSAKDALQEALREVREESEEAKEEVAASAEIENLDVTEA